MSVAGWKRLAVVVYIVFFVVSGRADTSAPTITSLTPTSGAVGVSVMISGTGFGTAQRKSTVRFNGIAAAPTSWSSTTVVVTAPTGATTGDVSITVAGVASNGKKFTVVDGPS